MSLLYRIRKNRQSILRVAWTATGIAIIIFSLLMLFAPLSDAIPIDNSFSYRIIIGDLTLIGIFYLIIYEKVLRIEHLDISTSFDGIDTVISTKAIMIELFILSESFVYSYTSDVNALVFK